MTNTHAGPRISMAPFTAWCNEQVELAAKRRGALSVFSDRYGPCAEVADKLGVHVRVLNRLVRGMYAGSRDRRKGEFPAETISRYYVEDLLSRAGVSFYNVYPEFAHEQDIELEPDAWCRCCAEYVTPLNGLCLWCDTPVDGLEMAA
jgi:hypothetical protein